MYQQLQLVIGIVRPGIGDIVEHLFTIKAIPFGDSKHTDRSERAFRVDVKTFSLTTTHRHGELDGDKSACDTITFYDSAYLASNCKRMTELRFTSPEFACIDISNRS